MNGIFHSSSGEGPPVSAGKAFRIFATPRTPVFVLFALACCQPGTVDKSLSLSHGPDGTNGPGLAQHPFMRSKVFLKKVIVPQITLYEVVTDFLAVRVVFFVMPTNERNGIAG